MAREDGAPIGAAGLDVVFVDEGPGGLFEGEAGGKGASGGR